MFLKLIINRTPRQEKKLLAEGFSSQDAFVKSWKQAFDIVGLKQPIGELMGLHIPLFLVADAWSADKKQGSLSAALKWEESAEESLEARGFKKVRALIKKCEGEGSPEEIAQAEDLFQQTMSEDMPKCWCVSTWWGPQE